MMPQQVIDQLQQSLSALPDGTMVPIGGMQVPVEHVRAVLSAVMAMYPAGMDARQRPGMQQPAAMPQQPQSNMAAMPPQRPGGNMQAAGGRAQQQRPDQDLIQALARRQGGLNAG